MGLLNKKIFIESFYVFLLSLFIIISLILLGRTLQLRDLLFGLEFGLLDTVLLFVYMTPTFLQMATPIASMISIFIVFLRLENDREMTALKAGGISLYQILPAPLLLSVIAALGTLYLAIYGISWGMYAFRDTIMDVATNKAQIVVQPGVFNKDIPGFVLYAKQVDPLNSSMSEVLVQNSTVSNSNTDSETNTSSLASNTLTLAPEGKVDVDREKGNLLFLLKDGKIYTNDDKEATILSFKEYIVRIPLSSVFKGFDLGEVKPKEMSFKEIIEMDENDPRMQEELFANRIKVEKHKRFVFAFACIVLALIAVPLSIACSGVKKQLGLLIAFVIFIFYYGLLTVGISFAENSGLNPFIGIWLPNIFFLFMALLLLRHYTNAIK